MNRPRSIPPKYAQPSKSTLEKTGCSGDYVSVRTTTGSIFDRQVEHPASIDRH